MKACKRQDASGAWKNSVVLPGSGKTAGRFRAGGKRRETDENVKEQRKERKNTDGRRSGKRKRKLGNPFLKVGMLFAGKLGLHKPGKNNQELCREIISLASGDPRAVKAYYGKKIADTLLALAILAVLSLVAFFAVDRKGTGIADNRLQRPGAGMGDRQEELTARLEGERETELLSVTVQEQKYTDRQVQEYLERARNSLEQDIRGENPSLDEVREKLNFPLSLEEGAVAVSWVTFPYGMIGDDGSITGEPDPEGSVTEIQATLTCQGKELVYETAACVYPPVLTEREKLWKSVEEKVKEADQAGAHESTLKLPQQVAGRTVIWGYQSQKLLPLFLSLTVLLPLCIYVRKDQKLRERAKQREIQMNLDYPELMWKLTMLLGAGLTIRGAFLRIASEYQKGQGETVHYVYEEMLYTCREMKSGIFEGKAYENFGKRCGLPRFIKLGSMLEQNLKKGSRGLAPLLEKEAVSSMEERKNLARKLGEQAGNKILFPMMLMLGIVMVILTIPAFLAM